MQATADALDLSPPDGGAWRSPLGWALGVHLLLVLALTWGVGWQRDTTVVAEAELWSRLPQVAAPRALEPEVPEPASPPTPVPPAPPTPPRPAPEPRPDPVVTERAREADIALARRQREQEREKEREQAARLQAEKAKAEKLKADKAEKARADKEKAEKAAKEAAAKEKSAQAQAAKNQAAKDKAARDQAARQEAQLEAERRKNIERILGQAGAQGAPGSRGTAAQSSGPSAAYGGRVAARIRPNIVFTDLVNGNPRAEVEVRALPDGTIVGSRLLKSSGHPAWDDVVLRAVERTGKLPQDDNGRVPGTLILGFRPQD